MSDALFEVAARGGRVVVLAGPGVVRAGPAAIDGLRALAAAGGLGVANTWGSKGVFAWDSPHHMGTAGLQARDFELLGFADADLIVATGVDPAESPPSRYALAPVVEVAPAELADLAAAWPARPAPPARAVEVEPSELYTRLAAVVQPLYRDESSPLSPGRVVADLRAALPPGGLLTADPGPAGFWVARTFPTTEPGSVVVPAVAEPGVAATLSLAAAPRPAIAVTTAPLDDATLTAIDRARGPLAVEAWGDDGVDTPTAHADALARALAATGGGPHVIPVAVDWSHTQRLIDVAGEIVAWT